MKAGVTRIDTGRVDGLGRPIRVQDPSSTLDSHTDKSGDCWLWVGGRNAKGYGVCKILGENFAHRAAWVNNNGPIPQGMFVCHRCDTPSCVNPSHLFLGTPKDNSQDMVAKGRVARQRGDLSGMAKVTDVEVAQMRALYDKGIASQSDIAAGYGIHSSQVSRIVRGKSRALPAIDLEGNLVTLFTPEEST